MGSGGRRHRSLRVKGLWSFLVISAGRRSRRGWTQKFARRTGGGWTNRRMREERVWSPSCVVGLSAGNGAGVLPSQVKPVVLNVLLWILNCRLSLCSAPSRCPHSNCPSPGLPCSQQSSQHHPHCHGPRWLAGCLGRRWHPGSASRWRATLSHHHLESQVG